MRNDTWKENETDRRWDRAVNAFDKISEAIYYGPAFRSQLANNPDILECAEKLAAHMAKMMKGVRKVNPNE